MPHRFCMSDVGWNAGRLAPVVAVWVVLSTLPGAWGQDADPVSLRETVSASALHDLRKGSLRVAGRVSAADPARVFIRVTDGLGRMSNYQADVAGGRFSCQYPDDFKGAGPLRPGVLFIDAGLSDPVSRPRGRYQAEVAVIVHGGSRGTPDLPSAFTTSLIDKAGQRDGQSAKWASTRALLNLYMRSRGAELAGVGKPEFDLDRPKDFEWYKKNMALYDFDHRDRNWATPLGNRTARTFWKSVWNSWFNSSNDHPWDGDPKNKAPSNYRPYAFANDYADWLVLHWMRTRCAEPADDNLLAECRDATRNLLAMQHRGKESFALKDTHGRQERYTAGAFRYGLFTSGEFLTEGTGWFYNPAFNDYVDGGVLNGRCVWGLGEMLRHDPQGPLAAAAQEALALALRFCLHDGADGGYVKKTRQGRTYWRDAGEHAYLCLGMLAASETAPDLDVRLSEDAPAVKLRQICADALSALADLEKPDRRWSPYPNVDSMALSALAQGARMFKDFPEAARWRATAERVADAWLDAKIDPGERKAPCVHLGYRKDADRMTHAWMNNKKQVQIFYYQTGHWIQALADLHAATGQARYRERAEALVSYLCGDNPWQVRLLTETGGIYNWSDDTDGDGIEDKLKFDIYPESSAFCAIGILRLLQQEKP